MVIKQLCIALVAFSATLTANPHQHAFLGVGFSEVNKNELRGIKVDYILPETAAARSELLQGDLIFMYDYEVVPTQDISKTFKDYIKEEKKIGDPFTLHVLRDEMKISRWMDDGYMPVDFTVEDVFNTVKSMNPDIVDSYTFKKEVTTHEINVNLAQKPFILESTPNVTLSYLDSIEYISPFYAAFFDLIKDKFGYKSSIEELKKKQLENEYWDNGFRLPLQRYLHVEFEKLPAFASVFKQTFLNASLTSMFRDQVGVLDHKMESVQTVATPASLEFRAHISYIESVLQQSKKYLDKAFETLSEEELAFMKKTSPHILKQLEKHFIFDDPKSLSPQDIFDYLEIAKKKVDWQAFYTGYSLLLQLNNSLWLDKFKAIAEKQPATLSTLTKSRGAIIYEKETDLGVIVIGGKEDNIYTDSIAFLLDVGGNDTYRNNAGGTEKLKGLSLLVDFDGNDTYSSTDKFSQGAALMGYALLLDLAGEDDYRAKTLSQGVGILGVGYSVDYEGDDSYTSQSFSQGVAFFGIGGHVDVKGDDRFHAGYFSQGVGLTKGFGAVMNTSGDDIYYVGGQLSSSYGSKGIFRSASQGFGFGLRNYASGGIGLLFDKKGNDRYEAGNFSLGTGYFYGMGVLIDQKGDDRYKGSRYTLGASAHSAIGVFSDWKGNDDYTTLYGVSVAAAWDYSNSYFLDYMGNDSYRCLNTSFVVAQAEHNSFSFFNDKSGKDNYDVNYKKPEATNSYDGGKSVAIHLDEGGDLDRYANDYQNDLTDYSNNSFLFMDIQTDLIKHLRDNR